MSGSIRWNPKQGLTNLRDAMNRILEEGFASMSGTPALALDMYETEDAVIVQTNPLIGVQAEDIDVSITGDVLTIRGETRAEGNLPTANVLRRERRFGRFVRSVTIPRPIKAEETTASLQNGVLTIKIPKAEAARPRAIEVRSTEEESGHTP